MSRGPLRFSVFVWNYSGPTRDTFESPRTSTSRPKDILHDVFTSLSPSCPQTPPHPPCPPETSSAPSHSSSSPTPPPTHLRCRPCGPVGRTPKLTPLPLVPSKVSGHVPPRLSCTTGPPPSPSSPPPTGSPKRPGDLSSRASHPSPHPLRLTVDPRGSNHGSPCRLPSLPVPEDPRPGMGLCKR